MNLYSEPTVDLMIDIAFKRHRTLHNEDAAEMISIGLCIMYPRNLLPFYLKIQRLTQQSGILSFKKHSFREELIVDVWNLLTKWSRGLVAWLISSSLNQALEGDVSLAIAHAFCDMSLEP